MSRQQRVQRISKRSRGSAHPQPQPRHLNRPPLNEQSTWISSQRAAEFLGVSYEQFRALLKRGEFPTSVEGRRLGRQRRFDRRALDAYMKQGRERRSDQA